MEAISECWKAVVFEHVYGKESRLSVVCIFMFHVQQHFPGDLAKPALAASEGGSCSFLYTALPPSSERSCALVFGWGVGAGFSLEKAFWETLDGQARVVVAGAYQSAQLSCRERSLCVQASCYLRCVL